MKMFDEPNRRSTILSLVAGGSVAACGMVTKSPFFTTIATFNRSSSPAIDQKKIDSIPYASLVAWFDGSARALLVLGEYEPKDRLAWYTADRQVLTTWGPFVMTLVGTEVGLYSTTLVGDWNSDLRTMPGRHVGRTLGYQATSNRVNVATVSSFKAKGRADVALLGEHRSLTHIREDVKADGWHEYANDYWIDEANGDCLKSRQLVIPTMPKLNIMIGKKPKGRPQT